MSGTMRGSGGHSGAGDVMTVVLALFYAGLGVCLVVDLVTDKGAPDRRTTGLLAAGSLAVAVGSFVTQAFG